MASSFYLFSLLRNLSHSFDKFWSIVRCIDIFAPRLIQNRFKSLDYLRIT